MSAFSLMPDQARLMAHIAEFAKRVKLSGSAKELESFLYLQQQMDSFGYQTRLLSHDAWISLPVSARVLIEGNGIGCITHSMSVSTDQSGISAPLVYVGEGREADFSAAEVSGKIVLVDGITTEDVTLLACEHGALGQLHISPTEHLYEMCVSPVWGSPSQHTRQQLPTSAICTISRDDGAVLRDRCRNAEPVVVTLVTEVDTGWRKTPILVAELPAPSEGADAPFVLFAGHHDTWHYGVMDNGGANATMLEAARLLASQQQQWQRGLRLCFWSGHSHGRYSGSAWYADEHWDELNRRCVAHVNVDSTGGENASVLTNSAVIDELKAVAAEAVAAVSGQQHQGRRHGRAADQSFWGIGLPSMFGSLSHQPPGPVKMLTALGWWWHTPHDTVEHISPANLTRDTDIVLRVLWRLLCSPVVPLDYTAFCHSLGEQLSAIAPRLAGRVDIELLEQRLKLLQAAAERINHLAANAGGPLAADINQALMAASRQLVPLNYTAGHRFSHDSALPHPAWPALSGLRELAALPPGDPDELFYAVHARQCRNLVAHALQEACRALASINTVASA
ncbi:M28 family peptidase [Biostraticola tofi]|uniref:PA domain-containing protein n=1 Tax=Biostraticola tofi TaxID=466109 RepID=A0A4R3Z0G9_9GAMM|nr:M28 family peptidase [Biostraticola tofi]TCV98342.1 PA domain-containing protein [Biostraticola tofi]